MAGVVRAPRVEEAGEAEEMLVVRRSVRFTVLVLFLCFLFLCLVLPPLLFLFFCPFLLFFCSGGAAEREAGDWVAPV